MTKTKSSPYTTLSRWGLFVGPVLFLLILLLPAPTGMSPEAKRMAAVTVWMATWWLCESVAIPVTALLPLPLFPFLGISGAKEVASPYAHHLIFLFMGGFLLALSMQRWNLHRRIAIQVLSLVGFSASRLVLGFMCASALLSAFVSNTATAVMMLPIGLAVIDHAAREGKRLGLDQEIDFSPAGFAFGLNIMLGIAYGSSIGGVATLIGSPPNAVFATYAGKHFGIEISFVDWMKIGVPLTLVYLPLSWFLLTRVINPMKLKQVPGGREMLKEEARALGPMKPGEIATMMVFSMTALAWIFRPSLVSFFPKPAMIVDGTIAMFGALLLFVIPVDLKKGEFVMNWEWAVKLPWGVLILFGGGLALADGFTTTGLAAWLGQQVSLLEQAPVIIILLVLITLIVFLTEITSNTATTAMMMPILAAVAIGLHQNPLLFMMPAALAASFAFMLPVATPPNAIVFGSGYVSIPQMARSGLLLNVVGIVLLLAFTYGVMMPVFQIQPGVLPPWATLEP